MAQSEKDNNGNGAERRAFERLTVDIAARADLGGRDPRSARIMDFCAGGMFMSVQGQEDDYLVMAARQIGRDERLRVTFDGDVGDGLQTFTVNVKVARLFLGGMGVAFDPPEPEAIRALQRAAQATRADNAASGQAPTVSAEQVSDMAPLFTEVRQQVANWLTKSLDGAFKSASDKLFIEARDAPNNDLQNECMDALKDVDRVHPSVRDVTAQRMLRAVDRLGRDGAGAVGDIMDEGDDEGGKGGGLALVDTGSFDDWVTTKNIITRHEPTLREPAYALARRLEVISGKRVDEAANPLGLQQLGSAFNEAMQNLGLERLPRQSIYHAFEEYLVPALGKLHTQLNTFLLEKGVLPSVERPAHGAPRRTPTPRAKAPAAEAPAMPPADEPAHDDTGGHHNAQASRGAANAAPAAGHSARGPGAGAASAPSAAGGVNPWAAPALDGEAAGGAPSAPQGQDTAPEGEGGAPPAGAAPSGAYAPQAFQPTYHSPIQPAVPQVGMDRAYNAARSLMGLQRAMSSGAAVAGVPQTATGTPAQQADGPSVPLMEALSKMQTSTEFNAPVGVAGTQANPIKERLRDALRRGGVALSDNEDEAVEVLGNLIEAVLGDPLIQSNVKPRIQRLSVPLLRTAMQDQGFFEQEAHPARQVINRLGMLGLPDELPSGQSGDSLQDSVDPLLERVLQNPDAGPADFEAVLPELDGMIERQNERFANNVGAIVAAREQQQAMLAERRSGESTGRRRVAPELEPWFKRTERLNVGDAVTFGAAGANPQTRTLAWVAEDHETFVFADREGRESGAVAQQELALDMLRGNVKVADSADVPAMDRGVYEMLHQIHRSLAEEGRRDAVTGLMPMSAFEARVEDAIRRAQRRGSRHALLALNLDGFSSVNSGCGRAAGDSLLRKLSRLLERQIGKQGCLMRAFADEFLILLEDHPFQDAKRFAERQCRAIENSRVVFEGEQYPITASIGMVPVTRAGESAEAVIENARAALAGAKRRGGNQLRIFDPDEDELPAQDADTDDEVSAAAGEPAATSPVGESLAELIDKDRIVLQRHSVCAVLEDSDLKPHFEVSMGLREQSADVVPISEDLLAEAERSERMAHVDRWVIKNALKWMAANRREVVRSGGYAINLSSAAFADTSLLDYVIGELTSSTVPPAKVIFGVTESVAIDPLSSAVGFIRALREYGCRFSIDDFGAGNATFSYLKTLPVDFVKIDSLFLRDLADNDNDYAMVKSINEIAHLMGKLTIADQVNTEPVLERLKALEVDMAGGDALGERQTMQ